MSGVEFPELVRLVSQIGMLPLLIYFIWQTNTERRECQANVGKIREEHHKEYSALSAKWNETNLKQIETNNSHLAASVATLNRVVDCVDDLKERRTS